MDRQQLITDHIAKAAGLARHLHRSLAFADTAQDFVQCAMVGLIEAADSYEPSRNDCFWQFARVRVYGAVIDALRRNRVLLRKEQQRRGHRNVTWCSFEREVTLDAYEGITLTGEIQVSSPEDGDSIERHLLTNELIAFVRDPRAAQIVRMRLETESPAIEIAAALGTSVSHVNRMVQSALTDMRRGVTAQSPQPGPRRQPRRPAGKALAQCAA